MSNIFDNGPAPTVVSVEAMTLENENYRSTLWTGEHLQMTLMAIAPGNDIGLEVHPDTDQFLRIEQGTAKVSIGPDKDNLQTWTAGDAYGIFVPAGYWHDLESIGEQTLKVYSIYAPSHHPHGTVQATKEEAEAAEAAQAAQAQQ